MNTAIVPSSPFFGRRPSIGPSFPIERPSRLRLLYLRVTRAIRPVMVRGPKPGDYVPATAAQPAGIYRGNVRFFDGVTTFRSEAQAEAQPPRPAKRWPGEYLVILPASFWKRRDLSLEAKGYAALLYALADHLTCMLPSWCNAEKLQHFAGISKRPRLKIERELKGVGILTTEREGGKGRGLYRRLIYRINLNVFARGPK